MSEASSKKPTDSPTKHNDLLESYRKSVKKNNPKKRKGPSGTAIAIGGVLLALVLGLVVLVGLVISPTLEKGKIGENTEFMDTIPGVQVEAESSSSFLVYTNKGAPVIDIYEDVQCPFCKQLEVQSRESISENISEGDISVRYHFLNILDQTSQSKEFSSRAAHSLYSVADTPETFLKLHEWFYNNQPREGLGMTDENIIMGMEASGATQEQISKFQSRSMEGKYSEDVQTSMNELLEATGKVATPVVLHEGEKLSTSTQTWVDDFVETKK